MPFEIPIAHDGSSPAAEHRLDETVRLQAEAALHSSYGPLRRVRCEYHDGLLTLHGRLPSYYLKQVAQEAVARLDGVSRVENRIEVISSQRL